MKNITQDRNQAGNKGLTPRQQQFVAEYLLDLNATQAAVRAGYSPRTATAQASRLLTNVKVAEAIAQAMEERSQRTAVDQDWVLAGLREVVDRCLQTVPVRDRHGNPLGEFRFNAAGAIRALEIIGKHLRMFSDKAEDQSARSVQELSNEELMAIVVEGLDELPHQGQQGADHGDKKHPGQNMAFTPVLQHQGKGNESQEPQSAAQYENHQPQADPQHGQDPLRNALARRLPRR